eukprot:TRINITY_DN70009_c0_g1_i1.p1 TRINITY_DN70009_c0_g1~~TRINITY_DN70009_c0_g1_i1.p1  ORF type:complete len:633 (+),score=242.39 TRINITY_DN70009_c0_g1_i1:75-1901(+)
MAAPEAPSEHGSAAAAASAPAAAAQAPEVAQAPEAEPGGWNCAACTYLNAPPQTQCQICGTPRAGHEPNGRRRSAGSSGSGTPHEGSMQLAHYDPGQVAHAREKIEFNDVFSLRRPKHLGAGVSSGLKSAGKGLTAGIAALVAVPYVGAKEDGVRGLGLGVVGGAVAAVGFVACGVTVGATQVFRGLCNTPEAIKEAFTGDKRWDHHSRAWVQDNLEQEKEILSKNAHDQDIMDRVKARTQAAEQERRAAGAQAGGGAAAAAAVADLDYYDALEVQPSASAAEIRRAYFRLANQWHPDKCAHPQAKEKFQRLSEAYQVLGDPDLRQKYDAKGKDGLGEHEFADPALIFAALFGSEKFEQLIGKLQLVLLISGDDFTRDELRTLQQRREARIAVNLVKILRPYVDGYTEAFDEGMKSFADDLANTAFGDQMLETIGGIYKLKGRQQLSLVDGSVASMQERMEGLRRQWSVLAAGGSLLHAASSNRDGLKNMAQDAQGGAAGDAPPEREQEIREAGARLMPKLVQMLWEITAHDVAGTLAGALDKLLHDSCVDGDVRRRRAEGLVRLGEIFEAAAMGCGKRAGDHNPTAFDRVQQAMVDHHMTAEARRTQ